MPKPCFSLTAVLTLIRDKSICSSGRQLFKASGWGQSHGKYRTVAVASPITALLCSGLSHPHFFLVSKAVISLTFCLFVSVWHLPVHRSQLFPLHLCIILNDWGLFCFNLKF